MKTLYLKVFGKILAILLVGVFIQNASAAGHSALSKKILSHKNYINAADTPRQVSNAKKVNVKTANAPGIVAPVASVNDITWVERGPNNAGGRTVALIFDKGDAAN